MIYKTLSSLYSSHFILIYAFIYNAAIDQGEIILANDL